MNANLSDAYIVLTATATSGLPVNYTCSDENVATVNGSVLLLTGAGQAIITASQTGNDNYYPAPDVMKILNVTSVGLAEYDLTTVSVWPNPTSDIVNLQCLMNNVQRETIKWQLMDIYGKCLENGDLYDTNTVIDLSSYSTGLYFLNLHFKDGQSMALKVLKRDL